MREEFFGMGIFKPSLCSTGDWCSESRYKDDIAGRLLENIAEAFL